MNQTEPTLADPPGVDGDLKYTEVDEEVNGLSGAVLVSEVGGSVISWLLKGGNGFVLRVWNGLQELVSTLLPAFSSQVLVFFAVEVSIEKVLTPR